LYINNKAVNRNKNGKCAQCNIEFSPNSTASAIALRHRYFYCKFCIKGVRRRDRIFIFSFIVLAVLLIGMYVMCK
jgi:late competence protein required for DNA uptake (superfamily II DNA/RNA helicase)